MTRSSAERQLAAKIAANTRWAQCEDRAAETAKARAALEDRFLREAGGDPRRAENLKRAHFQRLALKSATARRLKAEDGDAA